MRDLPRRGWLAPATALAVAVVASVPASIEASGLCGCGPVVSAMPVRTYRVERQTFYEEREATAFRFQWETEVVERPVTVYRNVVETEMRERRVTVRRPVYETNEREERVTVRRPVVETRMEDRSYDRVRLVSETTEREEQYTVRRPVWETIEREEHVTVRRPVVETQMREECVTVMQPITTMRQQVVQTGSQVVCQPVVEPGCCLLRPFTASRPLTYDTAGWGLDPSGQFMAARPVNPLFPRLQDRIVLRPVVQPTFATVDVPVTTMRPVTEMRQRPVQVVRYEDQVEVRRVPQRVCRWVEETQVRRVPVTQTRQVVERVERQVPVQVCRWVEETQVRKVPFTTVRYVDEERVDQVPVRVVRRVAEERVVQESRRVCRKVPYTYTYRIPRVETRYVELDPCTGMPVDSGVTLAPSVRGETIRSDSQDPADRQPALPAEERIETRREIREPATSNTRDTMSDTPGTTAERAEDRNNATNDTSREERRVPLDDDRIEPKGDVDLDLDDDTRGPNLNDEPRPSGVELRQEGSVARTASFRGDAGTKEPVEKLHENDFGPLEPIVRPGSGRSREDNRPRSTPSVVAEPEERTVSNDGPTRPYHVLLVSRVND